MFIPSPVVCTDFYKECHYDQYNPRMTKLVSYLTPRMSRVADKKLTFFGLTYFVKSFLHDDFNNMFFNLPKEKAVGKYVRLMKYTMGDRFADPARWEKLYDLGYLPLEISAVPEGTRVPMGCPMVEITNTHPDFVWLVNYIETAMSCTLWHGMTSANVGYLYRQIVEKWFTRTVEDSVPYHSAICDFSMRGQESIESAAISSAAFLLSFTKTATIPAIEFLEEYYDANVERELVATGLASTEHSVMCSSANIDGDETTMFKRLLTEIYPDNNFTVVSDSYDYWNVISNILPSIKELVMAHNGFMGIRGDSGDPIDIICGTKVNGETPEEKGTVEMLWDIFGGTVNSKGYKVLDKHVMAVYGDSITPERAEQIYERLEAKGFASNCVALGMGSYSMQSSEGNTPTTRDTYSIAVKSTYCEIDGKGLPIFKDPKTDTGHFKKSQKGCCVVYKTKDDEVAYFDGVSWEEARANNYELTLPDGGINTDMTAQINEDSLLFRPVYYNGHVLDETTLVSARETLYNGKF